MRAVDHSRSEQQALEVVQKWAEAFSSSDVDGIVALFAADATFFGTSSTTLVTSTDGIRSYFERALLQNRPRGAQLRDHSVMALSDSVVFVSGTDRVTGVNDGTPYSSDGRVTFILARREDGWRIVHFHRSAMPG